MNKMTEIALEAARNAAELISSSYQSVNKAVNKDGKDIKDFVTEIDGQAERIIVQTIKDNYQDHSIWGEESGKQVGKSEYTWVIDPIDGTKNFVRNISQFVISIGVVKNGVPIIGIIFDPVDNSYVWAVKGEGVFIQDNEVVSEKSIELEDSCVAVNFGKTARQREKTLQAMAGIYKEVPIIRMIGSTAYVVKGMAEGKFDALIDNGDYWDYAAGLVIAKEAGFFCYRMEWTGS